MRHAADDGGTAWHGGAENELRRTEADSVNLPCYANHDVINLSFQISHMNIEHGKSIYHGLVQSTLKSHVVNSASFADTSGYSK